MIKLLTPHDCCGCEGCAQICPTQCIEMREDHEGFRYPHIDIEQCIDCGACEEVCPMINIGEATTPHKVYAAKNRDESIRAASSSGGIFTLLAEDVLSRSGVVFGAAFDSDWSVEHKAIDSCEGLKELRGAKYVQSKISRSYIQAKELLENGREVLFSGTPCQIAGLKYYLPEQYKKLLLVDVVCHGVPSPKVWQQYLATTINGDTVEHINFRDKSRSWSDYNIVIQTDAKELKQRAVKNIYLSGFVKSLFLRPSCYRCPFKQNNSGSHITLGDFWGVEKFAPKFNDDRGVSLVVVNSAEHSERLQTLDIEMIGVSYNDATKYNHALCNASKEPAKRKGFFSCDDRDIIENLKAILRAPLHTRIAREVIWFAARLRKFKL